MSFVDEKEKKLKEKSWLPRSEYSLTFEHGNGLHATVVLNTLNKHQQNIIRSNRTIFSIRTHTQPIQPTPTQAMHAKHRIQQAT